MGRKILRVVEDISSANGRRCSILEVAHGGKKFWSIAVSGPDGGFADLDGLEFELLRDFFRKLDLPIGEAEPLPPAKFSRADAAATLCAVVCSILPDIWATQEPRAARFLETVSRLMHKYGYPGQESSFMNDVITTFRNSFVLGALVYGAKERYGVPDNALFGVMERFGAEKRKGGRYVLTAG